MRSFLITLVILLFTACAPAAESIETLAQKAAGGSGRSMKKLVQSMGSVDRDRSLEAYKAVIELGAQSEGELIRGLGSSDKRVFEACAAVLGNLGLSSSVPALIEALQGSGERRYAVVWALGEIGGSDGVPLLVRELGSDDSMLRKTAVRSLVKIGSSVSKDVRRFFNDEPNAGGERAAIMVLGELRTTGMVGELSAVRDVNMDAAVWALGRSGDKTALPALLNALIDERWEVRRQTAEALGNLEDIQAVDALERALDDDETVVREWAARSLETLTGRQVLYMGEDGD